MVLKRLWFAFSVLWSAALLAFSFGANSRLDYFDPWFFILLPWVIGFIVIALYRFARFGSVRVARFRRY